MKRGKRQPRSARLAQVCEIVEQWRTNRESPKSRVPEDLWKQAVDVARIDGVWATSKALRFNYEDLKRRSASAPRARTRCASASIVPAQSTGFVEIPASAIATGRSGAKVIVELLGARNDRMRIEADPTALDVAALVRAFWSREP